MDPKEIEKIEVDAMGFMLQYLNYKAGLVIVGVDKEALVQDAMIVFQKFKASPEAAFVTRRN